MTATHDRPTHGLRELATERELARAKSVAVNMGLESQYLTAEALGEILDGIVARRLAREAASV